MFIGHFNDLLTRWLHQIKRRQRRLPHCLYFVSDLAVDSKSQSENKLLLFFQTPSYLFKQRMIVSSFCLCDWDEEIMTSSLSFFASLKSQKKMHGHAHNKRKDSKDVDAEKNGSMAAALRGFFILKTQEVSSEAGRRANRPHWASSAALTPRSVSVTWNELWCFNLFATKTKTEKFHVVASRPASKATNMF